MLYAIVLIVALVALTWIVGFREDLASEDPDFRSPTEE